MSEFDQDLADQIEELCDLGIDLAEGGRFDKAQEAFDAAWDLLPEPKTSWENASWILVNKGDAFFRQKDYVAGREILERAIECPDAAGAGFLRLRLGQCLFELGEMDKASRELTLALRHEGQTIFIDEDPKYASLATGGGGDEGRRILRESED